MRLSRSKIELFKQCPRCFYFDVKLSIKRPSSPPYTLNSAVDKLLKKEFDIHRATSTTHPLLTSYGLSLVPFSHPELDTWRNNFKGLTYHHPSTGFDLFGAVDDIWQNEKGELHIVDYKSTSKLAEINLDAPWQDAYKRQVEVYQYLLAKNGFTVNPTAYFVYCNGQTDKEAFDAKLEFALTLLPYQGDYSWLEPTLQNIADCLHQEVIPEPAKNCFYCTYRHQSRRFE